MESKHYYKIPKEEFIKLYVLTKEDKEEIKHTLKICPNMDETTAKNLHLHKIYENSRFLNKEYQKTVKKMLDDIDKAHKKMSHTYKV